METETDVGTLPIAQGLFLQQQPVQGLRDSRTVRLILEISSCCLLPNPFVSWISYVRIWSRSTITSPVVDTTQPFSVLNIAQFPLPESKVDTLKSKFTIKSPPTHNRPPSPPPHHHANVHSISVLIVFDLFLISIENARPHRMTQFRSSSSGAR